MPGFILHLTAAQMLLKHLPSHPDFPYPISSVNDFLIGNLLPDATQQKESSHFRDPLYREKMMVFPDLTRFTAKYRSLLPDSSALGYYFHLYIDRKFFKDFIPQIVEFYNADGEIFQNVIFPFPLTLHLERSILCHPYPFVFFFDIPLVSSHNIS